MVGWMVADDRQWLVFWLFSFVEKEWEKATTKDGADDSEGNCRYGIFS